MKAKSFLSLEEILARILNSIKYFHIAEGFIARVGKKSQYIGLFMHFLSCSGMKLMNIESDTGLKN